MSIDHYRDSSEVSRRVEAHTKAIGFLILLLAFNLSNVPHAAATEFVALGDIPYGDDQARNFSYIGNKIRKAKFPFVIHYGDIKSGGSKCSDTLFENRKKLLSGLVKGGLFYTPGDNDWTDCDREAAGGYDELERLKTLREVFFTNNLPSDPAWQVMRQTPEHPENAAWVYGNLQFVTLHIVGTDNGRTEILQSNTGTVLDAVYTRETANIVWLDAAFDRASADRRDGLVIAIQADPLQDSHISSAAPPLLDPP